MKLKFRHAFVLHCPAIARQNYFVRGRGGWGSIVVISYSSSVPPNIVIKASLNNSEAGRELGRELGRDLGREPPPVAASPGDKKSPVPVEDLFRGIVSSEGGREGLGVRTLKQKVKAIIQKIFSICV